MTTYTPAQEFLAEVHEINSFIDDIISCPRKSDWHWPSFYLLYVDVDSLAMALMRAEHFFRFALLDSSIPTAIDELVGDANAVLGEVGRRQKAIFPWFYRMSRRIVYSAEDTVLRARLDAHVHPKSGWYQEFFAEYDAGTLSVDGKTLTRTVLPILAEPPYERVDNFTASCMLRRETFDFSTPEEQTALAQGTKQAAVRLGQISARMHAYLLAHCKLEDLLYPSSA
jgi:hypothetical protein